MGNSLSEQVEEVIGETSFTTRGTATSDKECLEFIFAETNGIKGTKIA